MPYKFTPLSELESLPQTGAFLVEDECFIVSKGEITDSIQLRDSNVQSQIAEARNRLDLPRGTRFYQDDENILSADVLHDEGLLLTPEEAFDRLEPEEQEDLESFMEHFS